MKTYKFLAAGGRGPVSGFQWPLPQLEAAGAWVSAGGPLEPCVRGAHVCRPNELAFWIHDELWEAEIDGATIEGVDCLVAERARLLRRVEAWQHGGAKRFTEACVQHALELARAAAEPVRARIQAYLEDAAYCAEHGLAAPGAHVAATAIARLELDSDRAPLVYRREREWQAAYITREILGG